jgi:hypothetical protein
MDFIIARAQATRAVQGKLTEQWVWSEKNPTQWDNDLAAVIAQQETVSESETALTLARGRLDAGLADLHSRAKQALRMAKVRHRNNPAHHRALQNIKIKSGSRSAVLAGALAWESAWDEIDPQWVPINDNSLAKFKALRQQCLGECDECATKQATWRSDNEKLNALGDRLDEECKAWYAAAGAAFPPGTPEGDLIRGQVPTTYTPPEPPAQAAITSATALGEGKARLDYAAPRATHFDVYHKGPSDGEYSLARSNTVKRSLEFNALEPGVHHYKVVGRNSRGFGPPSAEAGVSVS